MSTRFFAAALVVALTTTACQGAPGAGTGTQATQAAKGQGLIRGTVTTAGLNAASAYSLLQAVSAVPGAHVEVTSGRFTTEATAGADGSFSVAVPGGSNYTVTASHPDGAGGTMKQVATVTVPLADEPPTVDVASLVTRRTGSIQGVVALGDGADPEGADVFVPGTTIVGKVSAKGRFALANLPEGTWNVVVQKPGYQRAALAELSVQAGKPLVVTEPVTLAKGDATGGGVKALIRDGSGKAIVGASYSVTSADGQTYTAVSDAQGAVSLTGLPAGSYTAQVYRPFYKVPAPSPVTVTADAATDVGTVALAANVLQFGQVKGQLVDETGSPVDGAVVQLDPPTTEQVFTDSQGRFTLDRVMPGEYTLRAAAGGFVTAERSVMVDNSPAFVADFGQDLVLRQPVDASKPKSAERPAETLLAPQVAMTRSGNDVVLAWEPVGKPANVALVLYDVDVEALPGLFVPLKTTTETTFTAKGLAGYSTNYRVTAKPGVSAAAGYRVSQLSPADLAKLLLAQAASQRQAALNARISAAELAKNQLMNQATTLQYNAQQMANSAMASLVKSVVSSSIAIAGGIKGTQGQAASITAKNNTGLASTLTTSQQKMEDLRRANTETALTKLAIQGNATAAGAASSSKGSTIGQTIGQIGQSVGNTAAAQSQAKAKEAEGSVDAASAQYYQQIADSKKEIQNNMKDMVQQILNFIKEMQNAEVDAMRAITKG